MSREYLYAVQRAELLGQTPPSQEEWEASNVKVEIKEDDVDNTVAQDLNEADESAARIGGGLDELNNILSATQRKINRFKTVCGSLGTLLKVRVASRDNTPAEIATDDSQDDFQNFQHGTLTVETSNVNVESSPVSHKKIDINEKMTSHLDKLDSMITKAERAQGSMQYQTKMMKKIISK
ncbi:uncharacterized protein LOC107043950 [Diachasma alloeum]|uniref:uncharacterized protein LOC107043950 n=1 Tax=Diachasma alloeum TaxID=454923 RepID=UPI000738302C|nr:uncharacterized protein LOC107043950 [Diachasma alloeum]